MKEVAGVLVIIEVRETNNGDNILEYELGL